MELIYNKILEILKAGQLAALCTVVSTKGSTPLKHGAKMIVWEDRCIYGTIGGGPIENATIGDAVQVIKNKQPQLISHNLKDQHNMCCGGSMEIYIEPIMPRKKLFIFGGGHVGKAVVKHALDLDFDITVIDCREDVFSDWSFNGYSKVIGDFNKMLPTLPYDNSTFIVIATPDHPTDYEVLSFCINKPHFYLGMIGSTNKVAKMSKSLIEDGLATKEKIKQVDMPIGLDINAITADEISVSIIAKIIHQKNK
jgi:xanthine dehydrogenase accessory factor